MPSAIATIGSLRAHREEILAAARRRHASRVRVFEAIARGDARPTSDVDLLIDFDPKATLFDQVGITRDLEDRLGLPVDVISTSSPQPRHYSIHDEAIDL